MDRKAKNINSIAEGLNHLHYQKIIHRDFHCGNILYENDFDIVISDLGISKSSIDNNNDEIYGVISYMAPEILQGKNILQLQIFIVLITGRMPFWDQNNDVELIAKICKNFRPPNY